MATKKSLKPRDRFSYKDGYGYVLNEMQSLVMEPKKGKSPKFIFVIETPEDARFTANCPAVVNLAMDALDFIRDLSVHEEKITEAQGAS